MDLSPIALAQLPVRVGDVGGNAQRILEAARQAHSRGARILVCPELALLGYPPDDLLQRRGLPELIERGLASLREGAGEMILVVGYPEFGPEGVFNAAAVIGSEGLLCTYRKRQLPNYGVFDERRHFLPGQDCATFEVDGVRYGLSICEDLWTPQVAAETAAAGASVLLNLNASPFDQHKRAQRRELLRQRTQETGLVIAYVNAVGGQDDVVFDGDSQFWSAQGQCLSRAPAFENAVLTVATGDSQAEPEPIAQLYAALRTAVRDYVQRNGFSTTLVGLSGGIDSAVTLALAVDALGPEQVRAVAMPSVYSAPISTEDAQAQADSLGVRFDRIEIAPAMQVFDGLLGDVFAGTAPDLTEENVQARIRGVLLMAMANKFNGIVLSTGNKSEMAVGYCTLYGDMCGGFAPLKDVYKQQVYALARYRNTLSPVIPQRVIERAPSAELRPDQEDQDSLPPYDRLDAILAAYIEGECSVAQLYAQGFPQAEVDRVVRLVRLAEYKRRQAAPGPKVSTCAFGRERRYPITAQYSGL